MTNRTPVLLLWNQITSSRITYLIVMTLVGLSFLVGSIIYEIPIVVYAVSGGIFGTFCSVRFGGVFIFISLNAILSIGYCVGVSINYASREKRHPYGSVVLACVL